MSTAVLAAIIVVVVIVAAGLIVGAMTAARRRRLQRRFGPEYERVVGERKSQRKAEAELADRERRVQGMDIRPLDAAARAEYATRWSDIQERFVDHPLDAVNQAQRLVTAVMRERGYPVEGHDQVVADLSVQHASTLEHYRSAFDISQAATAGNASTEDLRHAMIHYRVLFSDLLGGSPGGAADGSGASGPEPAAQAETTGPAGPATEGRDAGLAEQRPLRRTGTS